MFRKIPWMTSHNYGLLWRNGKTKYQLNAVIKHIETHNRTIPIIHTDISLPSRTWNVWWISNRQNCRLHDLSAWIRHMLIKYTNIYHLMFGNIIPIFNSYMLDESWSNRALPSTYRWSDGTKDQKATVGLLVAGDLHPLGVLYTLHSVATIGKVFP